MKNDVAFVRCDRADDAPILAGVAVFRFSAEIDNIDFAARRVKFLNHSRQFFRRYRRLTELTEPAIHVIEHIARGWAELDE